ncbi:MAG TPA: hypothetical protein VGO13_05845 [Solirubrobacterales bacterium]|nr:hypothetical protein [Solirubrobacterales bacterium]
MIPLAHVGGVPVEELLPWLAGPGSGLVLVRAWLAAGNRRRDEERDR